MGGTTSPTPPARLNLEVYKKLTLIRKPEDSVTYEDASGKLQQITDLTKATSAPIPAKPKLNIPVPRIITVESYEKDVSATYAVNDAYVRHVDLSSAKNKDAAYTYCADLDDEVFLQTKLSSSVSVSQFESMIDALERATAFDAIVSQSRAEQLFQENKLAVPAKISQMIYQYWVNKRCRIRKPLLRIYWPITNPHDTNPHLVFRPREKEKYRLRKKRQNDLEGYKKLLQLKADFSSVKNMLCTIQAREKVVDIQMQLRLELFEQRIYDCVDTSGVERTSQIDLNEVDNLLKVPTFITLEVQQKKKRKRDQGGHFGEDFSMANIHGNNAFGYTDADYQFLENMNMVEQPIVPSFIDDWRSNPKQDFVTDWDSYDMTNICTYTADEEKDPKPTPFVHRRRIGRGGRVVIDRLPRPDLNDDDMLYSNHVTLFQQPASSIVSPPPSDPDSVTPQIQMSGKLNYLPDSLFFAQRSSRIAEISVHPSVGGMVNGGSDDYAASNNGSGANDYDALIVDMDSYIEACAKEQELPPWGEERLTIGPM